MATNIKTKTTVVALAQKLMAGTTKHLSGTTQVLLQGGSFTPAQINDRLQSLVNLRTEVDAAKAATKAKLANEKADMPSLHAFLTAYVTFVKAAFASKPGVLDDFGVLPKTRATLTAEAKTAAAAKRKATRAARYTTGPKQKKSVKGAVTGIVVTPIHAPQPVTPATSNPSAPASSPAATVTPAPHTTP